MNSKIQTMQKQLDNAQLLNQQFEAQKRKIVELSNVAVKVSDYENKLELATK